tara:strand:- start:1040 stop:1318 length:279 start_codon:yes stop_codon:yes gene_type:complete
MDNPEIDQYGDKYWYDTNGEYHRTDGPAIEYASGTKIWYKHSLVHRTDGPAVEWANGTNEWYLNDQRMSFEEWLYEVDISTEAKVMMKLVYG